MRRKRILCCMAVVVLLLGTLPCRGEEERVEAMIRAMSLREKVGQLFAIRPEALEETFTLAELNDVNQQGAIRVTDGMREKYAQYPCGGFVLFRKNIVNPRQLTRFTEELHGLGTIRPLLYIDEEGGRVARLGNHPKFDTPDIPPMGEIVLSGDPEKAYEAGRTIGEYLKEYGLDVDFAPVADVNTNPANPVIGDRAFGDDPVKAAPFVIRYLDGLHDSGILGCLKHFPGHGDTDSDTHKGYAETRKSWEELLGCEMIPFRAGIGAGAEFIMTAHIAAPEVTGNQEPATVSPLILTEKLRGELGYEGIIVTDALSMGAITESYDSASVSVACIKAGVDILVMPYDYAAAFEGVLKAIETGEITEERIDASLRRILRIRMR